MNTLLPNTIETIADSAFRKCWSKSISFPKSLKTIGEYAFQNSYLTFVELPEGIQSIGKGAFDNCHLDTVIINNSTTFGDNVFEHNDNLRTIIYTCPKAPSNWTAVDNTYVPDLTEYKLPGSHLKIYHIHEMITWEQSEFNYSGSINIPRYSNNVEGYTEVMDFSHLHKDAGEWCDTVYVDFKDNNNGHDFSVKIPYHYTIKPANLSISVENAKREYGDENPNFVLSYSGFINGENNDVFLTAPFATSSATKSSNAGEYPITISGGSAKNYTFVYEPGVLTITKAPLSAKVNDASRQYGQDNPVFTINYTGLKNGETAPKWENPLEINTTAEKESNVGTYSITATGIPKNYDLPKIESGILTVTKAPLAIKANNATRKYFEEEPSFTYSCTGFVNNDNVNVLTKAPSFSTDATKTSSVGKYAITPSGAETKNYDISYEQGELTITKRPLAVTSHCSRLYGEENPVLPIEYSGFVNNETENVLSSRPVATTTAQKKSGVGDYPITLNGGEAVNYDFTYQQGVLTITKASLSAKVKDVTKVYGTDNPSFSLEYYGLKNGETVPAWTTAPSFETEAKKASGVGQYAVKAVKGVAANYNLEVVDGTLIITPASLTIKADDASRLYYSDNPAFSYKCSGFVNGDNESALTNLPKLSTLATLTSNVGSYEIKLAEASCANYSISYVSGTLKIIPRTLKAFAGNYERVYKEENPVFDVKYEGFVGNEDENVLKVRAVASTLATITSDVGKYQVDVTGGSADNYKFDYIPGTLTINKTEQSIDWNQDLYSLKEGDQIELLATASSGLTVTYTSEQPTIAEVYAVGNHYYLDCKAKGEFWLVAVQDGNNNYYSSPRIRKKAVIGDASSINTMSMGPAKIIITSAGIQVVDAKMGDVIRVFALDGQLIHSISVDSKVVDIRLTKHDLYIVRINGKNVKIRYE